jgi:hypothetical protein
VDTNTAETHTCWVRTVENRDKPIDPSVSSQTKALLTARDEASELKSDDKPRINFQPLTVFDSWRSLCFATA